ncbi:NAD(P)H-dependent glycerol-3-phosphate dehydrogenase [Enterovirga rhinocerotis]|uniref:Glycerol-3-phosphate dehydrogenase [NAD(P)+] n=1 Tax=Enterovirga rhinocerotis TaxID=1339210 RepID=A0A4R7BXW3_9HYPH|nr:NAD(P)H-dependent glycerol-3-phosphate dehydrogenase [Enterovirga rhinocerotis]TDR89575.1 glycerol-3-phosphate dehydrogenase (NAD(P)+) [Enterovirga rhinocerotis]
MRRIAVIGGGAFGTALANAAALAGCEVVLWLRDAAAATEIAATRVNPRLPGIALRPAVHPTADPAALADAEAALFAVPAQSLRAALEAPGIALRRGCPIVICAKGIERSTGSFLSDVAASLRAASPCAVLSGPSFAQDMGAGLPTALTLACSDEALAAELAAALSGPTLRVYHATDVRGVEIGGAAKNVLAIAAGIVAGRSLGESARAAIVARGFAELRRFADAHGASPATLMGLSGLGDVVMSCSSPQSRNFAFGLRLGQGATPEEAAEGKLAEGAFTAEALLGLARARGVEMPIAEAVADVLAGRRSVSDTVSALMARPLKSELA